MQKLHHKNINKLYYKRKRNKGFFNPTSRGRRFSGIITINWMGKSVDFYVAEELPIGVDGFLGA
jgi:hypothetical protein